MKKSRGNELTRDLQQKMQQVGDQIKMARLRRNLSKGLICQRAMISSPTLDKVEKGDPTTSIGIYLRVLNALQLSGDILILAKDDELGRRLQDEKILTRSRASKQIMK